MWKYLSLFYKTRFNKSCQCCLGGRGDKSHQTERLEYFWADMFTEYQLIIASIIKGCIQYSQVSSCYFHYLKI